jgi:hypothetical protein
MSAGVVAPDVTLDDVADLVRAMRGITEVDAGA